MTALFIGLMYITGAYQTYSALSSTMYEQGTVEFAVDVIIIAAWPIVTGIVMLQDAWDHFKEIG